MKFELLRTDPASYFQVRIVGDFCPDAFLRGYEALVAHPDYRLGTNIVWDARESSFASLSPDDVMAFCDRLVSVAVEWRGGRGACIVSRAVDYGLSRMFAMLAEGSVKMNFRVFYGIDEALP